MDDVESIVICELILRLLDGMISDEQLSQLDDRLQENPEALQLYCNLMINHAALRPHGRTSIRLDNLGLASEECSEGLLDALAELGNTRYAIGRQESLKVDEKWLREVLEYDAQVAAKRADDEDRRLTEVRGEKIRSDAEESLKRFQTEERRRQEELAYKRYRAKRRRLIVGTGSLAVLLVASVFIGLLNLEREPPSIPAPAPPPVLARITDSLNAQWQQRNLSTETGTELTASFLNLQRGFVQIMFDCGAGVVLQGPASIRIETADQMWLSKGRLVAKVGKEAIGFTVRTPGATVVDYGTEFGVLVSSTGQTETHVFKGQVDVRSGPNARVFNESRRIKASEACAVDREGNLSETLAADSQLFQRYVPSPYELAVLESRPVAYWRFDPNDANSLADDINRTANLGYYDGSVQFTDGPGLGSGKKAHALLLDGHGGSAVIRGIEAPGNLLTTGYTHVIWVRADVIRAQAILATTGEGLGVRILSMTTDGRFSHDFLRAKGMHVAPVTSKTIAQSGTWYHVVVLRNAYDDRRLFINGAEEDVAELSSGTPSFHDTVYVGAMGQSMAATGTASFKGAVSEVAIYNRALKPWEIEKLYMSTTEQ